MQKILNFQDTSALCVCVCVCVCVVQMSISGNCVKDFVVSDSESKSCRFFPQPPFCTQDQQTWAGAGRRHNRPELLVTTLTQVLLSNCVINNKRTVFDHLKWSEVVKKWKDFADMMDNSWTSSRPSWDEAFTRIGHSDLRPLATKTYWVHFWVQVDICTKDWRKSPWSVIYSLYSFIYFIQGGEGRTEWHNSSGRSCLHQKSDSIS